MRDFGALVAKRLVGGETLLLKGTLGSGKTTFVQGLAAGLGVTGTVTSPTYTVVAEYEVPDHPSIETMVHVDLYRLDEHRAVEDISVQSVLERLGEASRITVIEWADRLGDEAPDGISIAFTHGVREDERLVEVYGT